MAAWCIPVNAGDVPRSSPTQIPGTQWETVQLATISMLQRKLMEHSGCGNSYPGRFGNTDASVAYSSPKQVPGTQWYLGSLLKVQHSS